jgi:hypothetical protein
MPVVHEPFLKLSQFCPHLPAHLGPALGRCPLLFGVLPVRGPGRCEPRQAILRLGSCRSATVQGAASVAPVRRPLAGRAFAGLGPAPLAGPIGAEAEIVTFWNLPLVTLKPTAAMGFYYTPFVLVVRGLGGSVRAP